MSSSSRQSSTSPLKSRSNTPLQLKSDNVKRSRSTSPLKQQVLGQNPLKKPTSTFISSPTRSPLRNTAQSPFTQLSSAKKSKFTIYQDDTDYRSQLPVLEPPVQEQQQAVVVAEEDKENVRNYKAIPIRQQSLDYQQRRIPLCDLDIKAFPGFVQESCKSNNVLEPKFQLTQKYKPEQTRYRNLPVFVTPPRRKLQNMKYEFKTASAVSRKNLTNSLKKCKSFDSRISKPFITKEFKDLKFKIFNDGI